MNYFPQQKSKRRGALFQVSKRFAFSLNPLSIEHLLLTLLQRLFCDIPISHYCDSTIEVKSDLIARKPMKTMKIYLKMLSCKNSSLIHVNKMYTSYE